MRKIILTLGVGAVALAGMPAFAANNASATIGYSGSSPQTCVLRVPTKTGGNKSDLLAGATASAATVNFTGFADANTALWSSNNSITLAMNGYCNYKHDISLQTTRGAFKADTAANAPVAGSDPFVTELNYSATFNWGTASNALTTDGTPLAKEIVNVDGSFRTTPSSNNGSLVIALQAPAAGLVGTAPLIAGPWSDILTLQIGVPL